MAELNKFFERLPFFQVLTSQKKILYLFSEGND